VHAYERYFGFREPPFSVTPDPRFFYANPAYREAYATLRYGVEARKGFILLTGEAGTGKTTLLRMLMQHADSAIQTAFIFNPPATFPELLQAILSELELSEIAADKAGMTAQFNDYLLEQFGQGHVVSVLIDEAQGLSHEMLEQIRLLSNLEARNAKLVQIVLMGQPELEQKLDRWELRQLKQRMALRCRIQPLQPEDVAEYIAFRLGVAGYEGDALFNRGGINKIALYSQGIPRLINVLCDNALLRACRCGATKVSMEIIDEAAHDLRLDLLPPAEPAPGYTGGRESPVSASQVTRANPAEANSPGRLFRKPIDWPALEFGVWFIIITFVAAGLVEYFQDSGLRLAPMAGNVAPPAAASRDGFAQKETPAIPEPRVSSQTESATLLEAPSAESRRSVAGDSERESQSREGLRAARNFPEAAIEGRLEPGPGDSSLEADDAIRSRVVVSLDRDKTIRVSRRLSQRQGIGVFNVVGQSLVREKPAADAEITGSFQPGTRVRVTGKAGEYLRVQSLDAPALSGYVHVEDAFFEPAG
jgi:general secretion pathway protein A